MEVVNGGDGLFCFVVCLTSETVKPAASDSFATRRASSSQESGSFPSLSPKKRAFTSSPSGVFR